MKVLTFVTITINGLLLSSFFDASDALAPQRQPQPKAQRNAINNDTNESSTHDKYAASLPSRRDALKHAFLLSPIAILATGTTSIQPANAIEACKSNSHNCIRTSWTAPSSVTSTADAAAILRDVLNSYPQGGQAGVDCNGWKIAKDSLDGDGILKLEYKSCVGPAALAINLGQPFIDDLKLELGKSEKDGSIAVQVRSSSRMGSGDLYVNRKRLEYLGKKLKDVGWSVPNPKYAYEM